MASLVFPDKTGLPTNRIRRYGRALTGGRCVKCDTADYNYKPLCFIADLRGLPPHRMGDQDMNGETFKDYLPPYSPDLDPIEQVFAKLKALLLRKAAEWNYEKL